MTTSIPCRKNIWATPCTLTGSLVKCGWCTRSSRTDSARWGREHAESRMQPVASGPSELRVLKPGDGGLNFFFLILLFSGGRACFVMDDCSFRVDFIAKDLAEC